MGELHIITNGHSRDLLWWHDLTPEEQAEFDWIKQGKEDDYQFFRYKGNTYCLADFVRTTFPHSPFTDWDGYMSDSFFSGLLIRYPRDEWGRLDVFDDGIIVGWYYS